MGDTHRLGAVISAALGDLDLLDIQRAERQALNRPSPSAMWDGRLYTTHGVTFSWAERGDDLIAESNYLSALRLIGLAAGDTADEDVVDATICDWLVGSLRQIFVRIRDERGAYTPAFCEAVRLALHARDHVLIDEQDHSAPSLTAGPTLRAAVGTLLYLVLVAPLGLGLATLVRDSAAGMGSVLGLLYVVPIVAGTVGDPHWQRLAQQLAPMSAGLTVQATTGLRDLPVGPWTGLAVTAAWSAAALLAGALRLRLRDA
ncbi:MAG TPA: hypothetical protein VGN37_13130 [Actinocatenispora sp.]